MTIPVNIITGVLGVGKTTAIRHLISQRPPNERWAIVVNEFGALGIDGAILDTAGGLSKGDGGGSSKGDGGVIILGIERLWLPVLRKLGLHRDRAAHARGGRPGGARARHEGESEDFPRWLHLLVPTALLHPDEYV